ETFLQKWNSVRKRARFMDSFSHKRHSEAASKETKGLMIDGGWRYDVHVWFTDTFVFGGKSRELRRRTVEMARIQPGERVLDVGCGTGTLAVEVARRVGRTGYVAGIDPAAEQIARARAKAARRNLPIDFQIGVIEQLPFSDQSFDVVFSTLMMHHLPAPLKRQGLAEIARVLKPGGRLVIGDFVRKQDRAGRAHFHAGGTSVVELSRFLADSGFAPPKTESLRPRRFSTFPGAGFILTYRTTDMR